MAKNRKGQIIEAAAQLIAQKGFEGLRTREIAEMVGINHATVHYHFNDKETLIEAVVASITEKIYRADTDPLADSTAPVGDRLKAYFRNNLLQRRAHPERFIVMQEIGMRANRDNVIANILTAREQHLYAWVQHKLEEGISNRDLRPSLNKEMIAMLFVSLLRGIPLQATDADIEKYMGMYEQIEQAMILPSR